MASEQNVKYGHDFYIDFLQIDFNGFENAQEVFKQTFGYLEELYAADFNGVSPHYVVGVVDKCIGVAQRFAPAFDGEELRNVADAFANRLTNPVGNRSQECNQRLNRVISHLSALYNTISSMRSDEGERSFPFYGFYNPDLSNKAKAVELLKAAIEKIRTEDLLVESAKDKLIGKIEKLIAELEQDKTNWPKFFGNMKQTIIVVAALLQIATSAESLANSLGYLESAEKAISETSIVEHYQIAIQNQYFLQGNQLLMLDSGGAEDE